MATTTIDVKGLNELGQALRYLSKQAAGKALRQAVAAGANVVKTAAKANELRHNKTGDLQAAIDTRRNKADSVNGVESRDVGVFKIAGGRYANTRRNRGLKRVGVKFAADPPSFYWRFLEFGTVHQPATPFLRPAFEQNLQQSIDAMATTLKDKLLKAGA